MLSNWADKALGRGASVRATTATTLAKKRSSAEHRVLARMEPTATALVLSHLCCLTFGPAPVAAQIAERIDVRSAEISVRVVADGEPLRGLLPERFQLEIGGQPIQVQSVEEVVRSTRPSVEAGENQDKLILLFDYGLTETAWIHRAQQGARELVLSPLSQTPVAIATYRQERGLDLLLPFSTDRRQILKALEQREPDQQPLARDPLGLVLTEEPLEGSDEDRVVLRSDRHVRGADNVTRPAIVAQRALGFLDATSQLAERLSSVPGRKTLILFSRGIADEIAFGGEADGLDSRSFSRRRVARAANAYEYGNSRIQEALERLARKLSEAGVAAYTIDLGTVAGKSTGRQSLERLAEGTGGEYISYLALGDVFPTIEERTSHRYIIRFDPSQLPSRSPDGEDNAPLEVRIVDLPRKAKVFSPSSFAQNSIGGDPLIDSHRLLFGSPSGDVGLRSRVLLPIEIAQSATAVPFVLEISGLELLAASRGASIDLEVLGYAITGGGRIADHLAQRLQLDRATVGDRLRDGGLLFLGVFELEPEIHTLRFLVRAGEQGDASIDVAEFRPGAQGLDLFVSSGPNWLPAAGRGARDYASSFLPPGQQRATRAVLETRAGEEVQLFYRSTDPFSEAPTWSLSLTGNQQNLQTLQPGFVDRTSLRFRVPDALRPGRYTLLLAEGEGSSPHRGSLELLILP